MPIFDYLKDVISLEDRKKCADFDLRVESQCTHKKKYIVDTTAKSICIYPENLTVKEKRKFLNGIKAVFDKSELLLVDKSRIPLLEKLYKYNDAKDNQILTFFKEVLSKRDWEALRDSLFLRFEFSKGNSVKELKQDITVRYGERGNIISNLCTAGYF